MLKVKFLTTLITTGFITVHCFGQAGDSTQNFAEDLEKLIKINSVDDGVINFSGQEAVSLQNNVTPAQLIEITAPYITSKTINAKNVCFYLLSTALFKKAKAPVQRQQIVEIICKNYLSTDIEIQTIDNVLLQLKEKDFNANAKKYIASLKDSLSKFNYGICAQLSAVAQIKENIPVFWKIVRKDIEKMQSADIDALASLARMGDKEAAALLCRYYSSAWNKREQPGLVTKSYVHFSKNLAFSLDRTILDCLIADFKNFDLTIKENGGDYFWWPGMHLGIQIAGMIKNYPYPKDYQLDPVKLLEWLNSTDNYVLEEK